MIINYDKYYFRHRQGVENKGYSVGSYVSYNTFVHFVC